MFDPLTSPPSPLLLFVFPLPSVVGTSVNIVTDSLCVRSLTVAVPSMEDD